MKVSLTWSITMGQDLVSSDGRGKNDLALHHALKIQEDFFPDNRALCVKAYLGEVRTVEWMEKPPSFVFSTPYKHAQ